MDNLETNLFVDKLSASFEITKDDMKEMLANFHDEMKRGLADQASSLKMLPAFVDIATSKEKGKYIALDLGGTNFRVLQIELDGRGGAKVAHVSKFVIPKALMRGTGVQLFNFVAKSIHKFLIDNKIGLNKKRNLGFTFSFPVNQTNISTGILINWTKGFTAKGVVGSNVMKLLTDSIRKFGMEKVKVVALANDTVGTLATGSYRDPRCDIGIIFGTGTNACYRERIGNIKKLDIKSKKNQHMIVNIEWGNFNKIPTTEYDLRLDKATNNPGKQRMEKMISGMYLGEIARLILANMIKYKLIFKNSKAKFAKGEFKTRHLSFVTSDHTEQLDKIHGYLEGLGILNTTFEERELLKNICKIVSKRAARISAAAISAVITWMDPKLRSDHTIAIDGTVYKRLPDFRRIILGELKELHKSKAKKIKLVHTKDGSGIGVAIAAAVATS
ncbi:MAG TPA: hypothetical protein ENI07_15255 [Desulfobacterales bacterium]|nr:hypothetical protein [Desulfobacterales bacterium]